MSKASATTGLKRGEYVFSVSIIGALFFIFGFVTWINGTLIQFLKIACELQYFEASLVTSAFYIAYFVMALPMSFVLRRTGYKNGMALGLFVMAIGALIFIPAAYTRMFGVFLSGLFLVGTGLTLLQTASNPYITIIGSRESAAARISIMGICNKMAGFISPLVLTALVMHGMDRFSEESLALVDGAQKAALLNELAARLILPAMIMAGALIVLGIMIKFSPLPDKIDDGEDHHESLKHFVLQIPRALRARHLLMGVISILLYVGVEVIAGDNIGLFGQKLKLAYAPTLTSFTMAFMVVGYIIGIITIPKYLSQTKALAFSAVLGVVLSLGVVFADTSSNSLFYYSLGWLNNLGFSIPILPNAIFLMALLGLANAMMWPAIWPLALHNMGQYTKIASALLIMGIIGGAILPPLYTAIAVKTGFQTALWIAVPIYLFIMYYAIWGHKVRE